MDEGGERIAAIMDRLGEGVTRNAVIGKVHRLGLERPAVLKPAERPLKPVEQAAKISAPAAIVKLPDPEPPANGVHIADLQPRHCRWIIAGEREHARYCGASRPDLAKPYCARHATMAYAGTASQAERRIEAALRKRGGAA